MKPNTFKDQLFSMVWWRSWILVVVGSSIMAAAFVFFINPYNIVPGGVYGAGVVLHYMFPSIQVGTFGFMLDIPLLIIAFWVFGGMFGARTIVSAAVTPLMMNLLTHFIGSDPATMLGGRIDLSNELLIACLFGGVTIGVGLGLVLKTRATTGGTDIISMVLVKYTKLKFSQSMLIVDSVVILFGMIVMNDWVLPLYSMVALYSIAKTVDLVIEGASYDKLLFIISDKHAEMRNFIIDDMGRGATYIKSSGMYTDNDKDMIFVVISRREVTAMQNKLKEIDPKAFVVMVDAYETFGDGFKPFPEAI